MDQENERVLYNIQNGTRMVSMLLFADARMALWLYQMLSRMYDQKKYGPFPAGFKTGANPLLCDAGSQSIGWNGPDCRVQ